MILQHNLEYQQELKRSSFQPLCFFDICRVESVIFRPSSDGTLCRAQLDVNIGRSYWFRIASINMNQILIAYASKQMANKRQTHSKDVIRWEYISSEEPSCPNGS